MMMDFNESPWIKEIQDLMAEARHFIAYREVDDYHFGNIPRLLRETGYTILSKEVDEQNVVCYCFTHPTLSTLWLFYNPITKTVEIY